MRNTEFYYAWKIYITSIRQDGYYSALLTDLSIKFDCILRNLIIVKLHAQDFNMKSLKLMNNYLTVDTKNKKYNKYRLWKLIKAGVPLRKCLSPKLFNMFL